MILKMVIKIVCLVAAVLFHQALGLNLNAELESLHTDAVNQVVKVTDYAASENPNTITEQAEIGAIIRQHVTNFDNDYNNELKNVTSEIEKGRQEASLSSPKGLCLKLQATKIDPARERGAQRAQIIKDDSNSRVADLNENTQKLIDGLKLDLDVKTIVQLCLKLNTKVNQSRERLACFDDYGSHLSIEQKSKGETLLERVDTIEVQSLRIADKASDQLKDVYAQNTLDVAELRKGAAKCNETLTFTY